MLAARQPALLAAIDRALAAGRLTVAQLLLNASAEHLPAPLGALTQARIHMAQNAPAQARSVLDDALEAGPHQQAALLLARARAWLAEGQMQYALHDARTAAAALPPHSQAIGLYATLLMEQGAFPTAVSAVRRAMAHGAADAPMHIALALALLCLDDIEAAGQAISVGLEAFPGHADLLHLADKCRERRAVTGTFAKPFQRQATLAVA